MEMIDVGKIYDTLGPIYSLCLLGGPALITFMAIVVSSSLWTRSKRRGFGHLLACLGIFIGAVAFTGLTSMILVLLVASLQTGWHLSLDAYWSTLGGLLFVNLFVSVIAVEKAITSDPPGSKHRYYYYDATE